MEARTITIEPLFMFGYYNKIKIYYDDIINANIGDFWYAEDFKGFPCAEEHWKTELKVIYKDKCGILVCLRNYIRRWDAYTNVSLPEETEYIWIEKHPKSTACKKANHIK